MSIGPRTAAASSTSFVGAPASSRSHANAVAPISSAVRCSAAAVLAQIATRAPSSTSSLATARPNPFDAPRTSAFLPLAPRSNCLPQSWEFEGHSSKGLPRLPVVSLRLGFAWRQLIEVLAAPITAIRRHGKVHDRVGTFVDGALGRAAGLLDHGGVHVRGGMHGVDRDTALRNFRREVDREHDEREF